MTTKLKRKQESLKVEIRYTQMEMTEENQQKLDWAYDILFDEVLKRRQEQKR